MRPDTDDHFLDPGLAGHPDHLSRLSAAGATVRAVRASCLCQGGRLAEEGKTAELVGGTTRYFHTRKSAGELEPTALARGLTHLRCWAEAADAAEAEGAQSSGGVVVLEAGACPAAVNGRGGFDWPRMLREVAASAHRGEDLLLLSSGVAPGLSAAVYAFSPRGCAALARHWQALAGAGVEAAEMLLARLAQEPSGLRTATLCLFAAARQGAAAPRPGGARAAVEELPLPPVVPLAPRDAVRVVVITLPHRADRRVEPLVGSEAALLAMRGAGFEAELLRASCYCERDALEAQGSLLCFPGDGSEAMGGLQRLRLRRYEGAGAPVGAEEAERLRRAIDLHYEEGATRLIDSMGGTVEGYVVDSNWPGAMSCAASHARALAAAALGGCSFALVFEDDAVIPRKVARTRGWCEGTCRGPICHCVAAWAACVEDAVALARRAPAVDVLYLGLGEAFERPGPACGLLEADHGCGWLEATFGGAWVCSVMQPTQGYLGGITQIGYTWQAQAILYTRSALEDVVALRLWEQLWAQDETLPHLYGRNPWNHRYMRALRRAGWQRKWVAGAPSDALDMGWVYQLETFTAAEDNDLGLGTAWQSSNSAEL